MGRIYPRVSTLEARLTPNSYLVTSLANTGPGSFRQALTDANANAGADTVTFDPAAFASPQTISLTTTLSVTGAVTVTGPSAGVTLKMTTANTRVIDVYAAPTGTAVWFENLTVTGGGATGGLTAGVYATGQNVTLVNCVFTGNSAASGVGAVSVFNGSLTLRGCTVADNKGTIGGGVTVNYGSLLIENCAITGNTSTQNAGGGVRVAGTATAGGITIRNSTIAGNTAVSAGGGVGLSSFAGTAVLQNVTITGNTLTTVVTGGGGGGVGRLNGTGAISLTSCIVAGNTAATGPDVASTGTVTVNDCAIGSGNGFTLTGANNLPFGADLKLGPLAANGGPTKTHALLPGSPAIDVGSNPAALTHDQRGLSRAVGPATDIGAFEYQSAPPTRVASVVINSGAVQRSRVTSVVVNFDMIVTLPVSPATAFELKRQGDGAKVGLTATVISTTTTSVVLTFAGAGSEAGSLADGRYTLTSFAALIPGLDGNGDGTAGDDFTLVGNPATNKLFRLFGDADGDGDADAVDLGQFRPAFGGSSNLAFDFDNDGDVDAVDYGQFRLRFGSSV